MPDSTPTKPRVYRDRAASRWVAQCPCGLTWHSRFWRLAQIIATGHVHLQRRRAA